MKTRMTSAIMAVALVAAAASYATPVVYNASFEAPDTSDQTWEPTVGDQGGAGWDFFPGAYHAGVVQENNFLFADFAAADGEQMGTVWSGGDEIAQDVANMVVGQTYIIAWSERARQGYTGNLWVLMDDATIDAAHAVSDAAWATRSVEFTATDTSHRLRFFQGGSGDTMTHIDAVSIVEKPLLLDIDKVAGSDEIDLSWDSEVANRYRLMGRSDLVLGAWSTNATVYYGDGSTITVRIAADQGMYFHRLLAETLVSNLDFELGTLDGWSPTGNAWNGQPYAATTNWPVFLHQGDYYVNTFWSTEGEGATGVMTSAAFPLDADEEINFLIGGWNTDTILPPNSFSYVSLNRLSDDAELDRVYAPNSTGALARRTLSHSGASNELVYVKIVDDRAGSFGWLAADDFRAVPSNPAITENLNFEVGTLGAWTAIGSAFASQPVSILSTNWPITAANGNYYINTYYNAAIFGESAGGESATGTCTSATFTLGADESLKFLLGGWSQAAFGEGTDWNYIALHRASDDAELDRVYAPGTGFGIMSARLLEHGEAGDVGVYVKIVDDGAGAYGWLAVDAFEPYVSDTSFGSYSNGGFELGDWSGWTVSGTAFGAGPIDVDPVYNRYGFFGRYWADSLQGGEAATGTLTSETFTFGTNDTVSFQMMGWSGYGDPAGTDYNYVALKRAADDSEIERIYAPGTGYMVPKAFTSTTNIAEDVYIEVVDNATTNGYAWLGVDDFKIAMD